MSFEEFLAFYSLVIPYTRIEESIFIANWSILLGILFIMLCGISIFILNTK